MTKFLQWTSSGSTSIGSTGSGSTGSGDELQWRLSSGYTASAVLLEVDFQWCAVDLQWIHFLQWIHCCMVRVSTLYVHDIAQYSNRLQGIAVEMLETRSIDCYMP
jgi:hypothetical protein